MPKKSVGKKVSIRKPQPMQVSELSSTPKVNLPKIPLNLTGVKLNTNQILVALLIVAAFLIGVLLTKVQYLEKGQGTTAQQTAPIQQAGQQQAAQPGQKVDVDAGKLPVLGDKNAKVTIVEFADFQCPFCEKWFTEVGPQIIKNYVDTGKAKFAYRHFAFLGDESTWAAEASECANEQGKFWQFHDYLFNNQQGENQGAFTKDKLKGFAAALGLNTSSFNSCLDSGKYTKAVTDDTKAGQTAGVNGTPTVFINGVPIVGAQPYSVFQQAIDQALNK